MLIVVVTGPCPPGRSLARWQVEGVRRRPASRRQLRDAFAVLLDQKTPFGRLALTQVVLTAGDALLTVSLAGSLFFKVSTNEAQGR